MVHHDPPPVKEKLIPNSQLAFPSFAQLDVISYNVVLSLASRNAAWHQAIQMAEVMATNDQAWEVAGMLWRSKRIFFEKEEDVASVMSPQIWITFISCLLFWEWHYFGDITFVLDHPLRLDSQVDINLHSPRPWMTSLPPAFVTQRRRCNVGVAPRPWPLGVKAWHLGIVSQPPRGVLRGWGAELEERRTKRNENNKS